MSFLNDKYLSKIDLIIQLTKREIISRNRGSKLGQLWSIITPIIMLGLYFIVFGLIFESHFGVLKQENYYDFCLALFMGLTVFNVISDIVAASPTLILSQPNYVKKIIFPLEILPITKVFSSIYSSFFSIILTIILIPLSHSHLSVNILLVPIYYVPLIMLALGMSWFLSSVGVFFRDINQITGFLNSILMYSSAIVYSPSRIPHSVYVVLKYNPILILISELRGTILWGNQINMYNYIKVNIYCAFIMILGYIFFTKTRPYFAEVI